MSVQQEAQRKQPLPWALLGFGLLVGGLVGVLMVGVMRDFSLMAAVVGLAVVVAAMSSLELGLIALVFLTYTRFSDVAVLYHGAPSVARFFMGVLLVGLAMRLAAGGEKPVGWQRATILMAGFLLLSVGSLYYAADTERAWDALDDFIKDGLIVITLVLLLQRGSTLRWVIWSLLAAGVFMGGITAYQYLTGTFSNNYLGFAQAPVQHIVGLTDSPRVAGPIGDPNFYAQVMLALVPLALDRLWNERNQMLRIFAAIAFGLLALTVALTFSRGGLLALVFVVVLMFIYRPPRLSVLLLTLVLVAAMVPFLPVELGERVGTLVELIPGQGADPSLVQEPSFRGRLSELLVGWRIFLDHPIIGVGMDNYNVYYLEYSRRLGLDPRLENRSAHNLFLEVASETGLVGLAIFGFILFETFAGVRNSWKRLMALGRTDLAHMVAAVGVSLTGYLAAGMFIHNAYPRYFWLLVGIALALPQVARSAELGERD